jgi:hypothetical protein
MHFNPERISPTLIYAYATHYIKKIFGFMGGCFTLVNAS